MKKFNIFLLLFAFFAGSSCKKFIDDASPDQLIPKTTQDFIQLLYGKGYPGYSGNTAIQPSTLQKGLMFMDDDVQTINPSAGTNNAVPANKQAMGTSYANTEPMYSWQYNAFEILATTGGAGSKDQYNAWANYYSLVLGTNLALNYADGSQGSKEDKDYLKGQAYGLRAFYYFMLVNLYAKPYNSSDPAANDGVPLILSSVYDINNVYAKRNTVKEVYAQITSDLDSSIHYLEPAKKVNNYRMNYIAAHLLASRVYLYMENWNKTIEHATAVISAKSSLFNLSAWPAANPKSSPVLGVNATETVWAYGSNGDYSLIGSANCYRPSDELVNLYETGDYRKGVYLINQSATVKNQIGYAYIDGKHDPTVNVSSTAKAFRTAEAYLNRAEAYAQLNKTKGTNAQNALNDLNKLRSTRINTVNFTNWTMAGVSNDSLINACRTERRRELFLEDQRWFDLRRYGMPSITHVVFDYTTGVAMHYTLQQGDPSYVWPIPQEVLDRNLSLKQNTLAPTRIAE